MPRGVHNNHVRHNTRSNVPLLTREQKDDAIEMYCQGITKAKVASVIGCTTNQVTNLIEYLKRHDYPLNKYGKRKNHSQMNTVTKPRVEPVKKEKKPVRISLAPIPPPRSYP